MTVFNFPSPVQVAGQIYGRRELGAIYVLTQFGRAGGIIGALATDDLALATDEEYSRLPRDPDYTGIELPTLYYAPGQTDVTKRYFFSDRVLQGEVLTQALLGVPPKKMGVLQPAHLLTQHGQTIGEIAARSIVPVAEFFTLTDPKSKPRVAVKFSGLSHDALGLSAPEEIKGIARWAAATAYEGKETLQTVMDRASADYKKIAADNAALTAKLAERGEKS